jgi:hypothetical protein
VLDDAFLLVLRLFEEKAVVLDRRRLIGVEGDAGEKRDRNEQTNHGFGSIRRDASLALLNRSSGALHLRRAPAAILSVHQAAVPASLRRQSAGG